MGRGFDRGLAVAVGVLAALLLGDAWLSYRNTHDLNERAGWVAHTLEVEEALANLRATVTDAQAGVRAYLLSGDGSALLAYRTAAGEVDAGIDRVARLTEDNPAQQGRIPRLRAATQAAMSHLARLRELRKEKGLDAARQEAGKRAGSMDAFLALVAEMRREEKDLLRDRQARTQGAYRTAVLTGLLAAAAGLAAVVVVVGLGRRSLRDRARAAARLHQERERLRVSLASIGDAVIATDTQGRVTFLNPTAEALTGWPAAQAQGQPLEKVFAILNEQTRQPAPNPVAQVLREGAVVGLANHTVLVARDGTERPVEDSAAPIRAADGSVIGVILVFHDVTERRRAARALRESEERFRTLADSIPQLAWTARPDGHITWYNRRWYEYTGTTPEQMEGWGWQAVHDPAELPKVLERWKASLATGEPFDMVFPLRGKDGVFRPFLTRVLPLRGEDGRVLQWFGTNTDISSIKELEGQLKDADRRKDEFLATLSHELRNPLAPLRNGLEILKMAGDDAELAGRARAVMERQLGQLVRLIDDLLDVSRITRGRLDLRKQRVDLAGVVRSAVEDSRPAIEAAGHRLTVTLPPEPVWLDADPVRLAQVFANLLTNAAKYTDAGGQIGLTAECQGDEVVVSVTDSGIGIAAEHLPRLFQMFSQATPALERAQGGLGIGLSLVRGLVEMHGGAVEARSDGPGKGSEFIVRLPLAPGPPDRGPSPAQGEKGAHAPARRILVADDNPDAADSLALVLRLGGHEVHAVHNGQEAVEAAERMRPDLALLDIGMPGLNGYEAARRIRQRPGGEGVVLVAVTGWGQDDDKRKAAEAGFDRHLTKPVDPQALEEILAKAGRAEQPDSG